MRRHTILVAAILAALSVAAGFGAWSLRVTATRRTLDARATLARELLSSGVTQDSLSRALASPLLDVAVIERSALLPPPMLQRGPPLPRDPRARAARSPLARVAGSLAGIPPLRVPSDEYVVILAPNVLGLGAFLLEDACIVCLFVALVLAIGFRLAARAARDERRRLEATLEERRAAAAEFQRFLADAGHELRTPLTIVGGYVEILEGTPGTGERVRQILREMRAETARMRALVEKMLLLARLDAPVSVPRLVDLSHVTAEAAHALRARFPSRSVVLRAPDAANVIVDPDDAYEAIRNLLENALQYAPHSTVELAVAHDGGRACVTVSDNGPGVGDAEREKIFERFYRGSAREDVEGSGLGLAIVARVAARWNGTVALQSQPGRTVFTLAFPLAEQIDA